MHLKVCQPLQQFHQSVNASCLAHRDAWEKAGILHRDISIGNILIDATSEPAAPRGLLADWDLSKHRDELDGAPTQPGGRSVSSPTHHC